MVTLCIDPYNVRGPESSHDCATTKSGIWTPEDEDCDVTCIYPGCEHEFTCKIAKYIQERIGEGGGIPKRHFASYMLL